MNDKRRLAAWLRVWAAIVEGENSRLAYEMYNKADELDKAARVTAERMEERDG